ncbi:hypothetical protein ACFWP7_31970 [Streptomyces sp. NPDC058470]|uniref:hypothetical protein n=1 Tax=Streptomyces sp. NPDC058470 TaxID=3346515 RepID=UPI0036536C75
MTTTTSHSPAIAAKGLRRSDGDKTALYGIDLTVPVSPRDIPRRPTPRRAHGE